MRYLLLIAAALLIAIPTSLDAQVTTATLLGAVRDTSGAVVPGATVIARHQGTGVPREAISDERGEFVLTALATGPYSVTIALTGFKTYTNEGMVLGAGQTVRQTFTLEIGTVEESVLVAGEAPIVETAASLQAETLGSQEVRELPVNRRNLTNLLGVAPGVSTSGSGDVQMNGVAGGGTGITVDGTEANSNPEERSMSHYGGQNQISVMSLDSIAEVQVVRGVLPAEYGGVAGGQVNVISRSGTNSLSGSAFYSFQSPKLNARSFFSTTPKGTGSFNQYGGTLGGPVVRSKLFFFATYEGYKEKVELNLTGNVPNQNTRNALLAALPFPETKIALDTLPLPTEPIVSAAGVVDAVRGRYRGLATRRRTENHVVVKGDLSVFNGGNLSGTYTRMRPWTLEPRFNVNGSNDRVFPNAQDRVASQFVMAHGQWVSESRFGWNRTDLQRLDEFFKVMDPDTRAPGEIGNFGRRVGLINISGLFSTPSAEIYDLTGGTLSFDQKLSRTFGRHFVKTGFRWVRQTGDKMSPQNPQFAYPNLADTLANIPQSITVSFGAPRYKSHIDEFGGFIQDDWRLGSRLVLNLGLRYDYYATIRMSPTTDVPAEIVNLAPYTDLRKMDFGPPLDPQQPYEPDSVNFGPRLGFAWTLDNDNATVVRGGVGYLYSPHLPATVRQSVADPYVGFRVIWNRTEVAARRLGWPDYNDDFRNVVLADGGGRKTVFSVFDPEISAPYTIQSMLSVQRGMGRTMAAEVGYIRTDGRSLPLQRQFALAFDRQTGARPNPLLGAPGGYYVDSNQTLIYNALQSSLRKRFSNNYSFDVNYTLGKGVATQGGDLAAYYLASIGNTQDFWDPEFDRGPADNDIRHRLNATFIYELPGIRGGQGLLHGVLGGWQVSGILSAASGGTLSITQPSGITASRPDVVPDVDLIVADWESTCSATGCNYLNRDAFVRVPVSSVTTATLRPGNYKVGQARGPAIWLLNSTFAKNFGIGPQRRLQIRADVFNVLNAKNFSNPISNIDSSDFGRIIDAQTARTVQLGARLSF
jgi:outer membrane receptor protein involved in Fe transport